MNDITSGIDGMHVSAFFHDSLFIDKTQIVGLHMSETLAMGIDPGKISIVLKRGG